MILTRQVSPLPKINTMPIPDPDRDCAYFLKLVEQEDWKKIIQLEESGYDCNPAPNSPSFVLHVWPVISSFPKKNNRFIFGKQDCSLCGATDEIQFGYDITTFPCHNHFSFSVCTVCLQRKRKQDRLNSKEDTKALLLQKLPIFMQAVGVPLRTSHARIEEFQEEYQSLVQTLLPYTPNNGYYIYGNVGVGKTYLMGAMVRQLFFKTIWKSLNPASKLQFTTAPKLLLALRETISNKTGISEADIINKCSIVPILFLDDLGSEKPTEWAEQALYMVIDSRYQKMLPTVFSSNLTLQEISNRVGDRITSRIAGMCVPFCLKGKDRRISG